MIIEFIKDHSAGITKGTIKELDAKFSEKMISEGYAKESSIEDLQAFRKGLDQQAKEKLSELQKTEAKKQEVKANSIGTKKKDCGCEEKEGKKIGECEECKKKKEAASQKKTVVRKRRTTKKK
jgi:hypothetical protein